MFYNIKSNDQLSYNPFKSCIVPRPIGWISSVDVDGVVNLAPFSYFNAVADSPPTIMFSSSQKEPNVEKDTVRNIEATGEFVVNIATYDAREQMLQSSIVLPYGVSETEEFNIDILPSSLIKPPRIRISPINLECRHIDTIELEVGGNPISSKVVFGHVIGIHIRDDILVDGKVDVTKLMPIARLGHNQYAVIDKFFTMQKTSVK